MPETLPEVNGSRLPETIGVVIATRNRPESIRDCLGSLDRQTILPNLVMVVDSSTDSQTKEVIESLRGSLRYECRYVRSAVAGSAQQRNEGAELCHTDLILFLDDDVVLDSDFVAEILSVFQSGDVDNLAGVSGAISNQSYSDPKGLNRLLLGMCLGRIRGSYAGRVLGPAVNFLPPDEPGKVQVVEWLPSTCTAYRRDVFLAYRFEETFRGYSFAEDVHLSTRIAQSYTLVNTTRARVFHADLGKDTHRDWGALGESQVRHRFLIMTAVLKRNRFLDHLRLFSYEMIYCPIAWLAAGVSKVRLTRLLRLLQGKLIGFWKVWIGAVTTI